MASIEEKVRKNRLRRMAKRQGYALHKTRRRDPKAYDYGAWWIFDVRTNALVEGPGDDKSWPDLDAVEQALS
jgi:hypothetical protein